MARLTGITVEAERTELTEPLTKQINLLGDVLGAVVREQIGPDMLDLVEELHHHCEAAAEAGGDPSRREEAIAQIQTLDVDTITRLIQIYTAFFHLVNKAEQREIIRINRKRARQSSAARDSTSGARPRPESIDATIAALKEQGYTLDEVKAVLRQLDIQPTLTAHPTEARRQTVLRKQQQVAGLLGTLQSAEATPDEQEAARDALYAQIALLLGTDEVRTERPTVYEEVEQGHYFLHGAIWDTVAQVHQDVQYALRRHYGTTTDLPPFLQYRSWIGSDRDGNPNVTADVTRWTFAEQRRSTIQHLLDEMEALHSDLSVSSDQVTVTDALLDSIERDAAAVSVDEGQLHTYRTEPYRKKLLYMRARMERLLEQIGDTTVEEGPETYTSDQFVEDLALITESLEAGGFRDMAHTGPLHRLRVLAQTFGFHLAPLDIRQHSGVLEEALTELLRIAGVTDDYAALDEADKLDVLQSELENPRPLVPATVELPDTAERVMSTFTVIREILDHDPKAMGSVIVSMTHSVSDLLEPMLLAKEAGIGQMEGGAFTCAIDFVPLFETIDDLDAAHERMEALFTHPVYAQHLNARDRFQEVMLGYSDSNKDGGYWMANWALHKAIDRLGRMAQKHDVDQRLFHGRGGTVGRGGGHTYQAIRALPSAVHNGRIRFTEQGEIISFRYSLPEIARRHVEQIVSATLTATAEADPSETARVATGSATAKLMDRIADHGMDAYRSLIDDPELWPWYTEVTPIEQISRLPIASRPVSRAGDEVDFENLRAIPWVFAWTQTRYIVPGWYGTGQSLTAVLDDEEVLDQLRTMYEQWPFFRAVLDSAQREMARARLTIAVYYKALARDPEAPFHDRIANDFREAEDAILEITGQRTLFENSPVLKRSIALRNPFTDVLNLLQVNLLKRYRQADEAEREPLREALFLSIKGVAAAMQSTG